MAQPLLRTCTQEKPSAPFCKWSDIARLFREGRDTLDIARALNLSEAAVANVLALALEQAR